ncbi:hypothetical protein E1B28_005568 [Marasmius oreades]|uniref:Uncharacterized protein n=1 Tax=Marasmius oreades TaxID=181124 RepID=A0A9P7S3Q9_9AGAR|nr:uncharacterized protein E1B28_005568 [Marasmius oreades]KAG7094752.1 hypothetical protein E1B28_005568 [Marasmius oreades]
MLRQRVGSLSNESRPPSSFNHISISTPTTPTYPHVSIQRSLMTVLKVYSPSVKVVNSNTDSPAMIPAFGSGDKVGGTVELDPACSQAGRLSVSIEGSFSYSDSNDGFNSTPGTRPDMHKHVFFSSCRIIPVSSSSEFLPNRSGILKGAFSSLRKRPSVPSLKNNGSSDLHNRLYPFEFELPRSCRPGEELPPTFASTSQSTGSGLSSSSSRYFCVEYKLQVAWEPTDASEYPSFLEVPLIYHPDLDFQSVDCSPKENVSWLEMPLRSDRPMPFRCAITLPTPVTFSRSSFIPYYVVFTTTPRSLTLAKEIASDATISVTLVRKITVTEPHPLPPTPPQTPSTNSDDSDSSRGGKLLKRVARSRAGSISSWSPIPKSPAQEEESEKEKPLPRLPMHAVFSDSQPLHTSICIGFPKRPRHQLGPEKHPTLDSQAALPDGLHKAKFLLIQGILPSIDWAGVSVKYYLDVSVLIGQDDVRARVPIQLV